MSINFNSPLPEIEWKKSMLMLSYSAAVSILEPKLDNTVFKAESSILGYDLIRRDRNRHLHVLLDMIFAKTLKTLCIMR